MQYDWTDELFALGEPNHFPSLQFDRRGYETVLQIELDRIRPMCEGFEYPYQRERRQRWKHRRAALRGLLRPH